MAAGNPYKFAKSQLYPQKSNGISFWAFLLSILVYTSIFYIFKLSPSSLVNTTKFWFFISNTLILIIAVDFGAFSNSSRKQADQLYEYYVTKTQERSQFLPQYCQIAKVRGSNSPEKFESDQEKIKEVKVVHHGESEPEKSNMQMVLKDDFGRPDEKSQEKMVTLTSKGSNEIYKEKQVDLRRTQSEGYEPRHTEEEENEGKQFDLRRTQSERYKSTRVEVVVEEEDELSAMSNEELNRRVEDFIERFNRQIRLQAVHNRNM